MTAPYAKRPGAQFAGSGEENQGPRYEDAEDRLFWYNDAARSATGFVAHLSNLAKEAVENQLELAAWKAGAIRETDMLKREVAWLREDAGSHSWQAFQRLVKEREELRGKLDKCQQEQERDAKHRERDAKHQMVADKNRELETLRARGPQGWVTRTPEPDSWVVFKNFRLRKSEVAGVRNERQCTCVYANNREHTVDHDEMSYDEVVKMVSE